MLLLFVSGFCHFGLVLFMVLWQSPDTPIMSAFSCERAASSVLESRALSSACLVSCWSVVFGSRHSCLEFRSRDGVRTLALHFLSLCECAVSSSLGTAHSCPRVFCCVARSSCFYRLRAFMLYLVLCGTQLVYSLAACFHVVMSCVNTWLMSFLISCVFMSCFPHGWWIVCWPCACVFVLCEYMASVLVFCVPCALMSICLDPTHLVTCLLINFPQLLSLITLIICSLYNLLVFAVPCGFVTICWVVQSSPSAFPLRGSFCLFCLSLLLKVLVLPPAFGSSPHPFPQSWQFEFVGWDWFKIY